HKRIWFRVLCLANISQSGRRYEEGLQFLKRFDEDFNGFRRLWEAGGNGGQQNVVDGLIRQVLDVQVQDRAVPEQTFFWRRLYDFVRIRELLQDRQFLEGFWDTAAEHPEYLAGYLHWGRVPGGRFQHRGLGESLSSQAFFICRECLRLG